MKWQTWLSIALFLLVLPSCGPVAYGIVSLQAQSRLKEAAAVGGAEQAPYWYYRAEAYREKAREEAGYADYGPALRYSRIARESAKKAIQLSKERPSQRGSNASK